MITAADATHPSFGCQDGAEWTYFGDAFFNTALRRAKGLRDAFNIASKLVRKRELSEGFEPSNPQIAGGQNIDRLLIATAPVPVPAPAPAAAGGRATSGRLRPRVAREAERLQRSRNLILRSRAQHGVSKDGRHTLQRCGAVLRDAVASDAPQDEVAG